MSPSNPGGPHPFASEEIRQAWIEETHRRSEEIKRGEVETIDGDEFMARMRAKFSDDELADRRKAAEAPDLRAKVEKIQHEWDLEAQRRSDALDRSETEGRPHEEVMAAHRARLG